MYKFGKKSITLYEKWKRCIWTLERYIRTLKTFHPNLCTCRRLQPVRELEITQQQRDKKLFRDSPYLLNFCYVDINWIILIWYKLLWYKILLRINIQINNCWIIQIFVILIE